MNEYYKRFSIQENRGFKMKFENGFIVSVVWHDYDASESFDEETGGMVEPHKKFVFTFNGAELAIFKDESTEFCTDKFCSDIQNFDYYENILLSVTPEIVTEVLQRVSAYKEDNK